MPIDFNQRVAIPDEVMVSQLGDEAVLLNLKSESYFGLDEVGAAMWDAVRSSKDLQGAYDRLLSEYDVDAGTLKSDLCEFLDQLATHGLITLAPPLA